MCVPRRQLLGRSRRGASSLPLLAVLLLLTTAAAFAGATGPGLHSAAFAGATGPGLLNVMSAFRRTSSGPAHLSAVTSAKVEAGHYVRMNPSSGPASQAQRPAAKNVSAKRSE